MLSLMPYRRLLRTSVVLGLGCALVFACGGKLDRSSSTQPARGAAPADGRGGGASTGSDPGEPASGGGASGSGATTTGSGDCSIGATCQVFEPGGPDRWGCSIVGTDPELACEHAAGASVARCNCSGHFGDDPAPSPEGGTPTIAWFEVPATSTPFPEEQVLEIWKAHCDGHCVPQTSPPPSPPDGG